MVLAARPAALLPGPKCLPVVALNAAERSQRVAKGWGRRSSLQPVRNSQSCCVFTRSDEILGDLVACCNEKPEKCGFVGRLSRFLAKSAILLGFFGKIAKIATFLRGEGGGRVGQMRNKECGMRRRQGMGWGKNEEGPASCRLVHSKKDIRNRIKIHPGKALRMC